MQNRRKFIKLSATAGAGLALIGLSCGNASSNTNSKADSTTTENNGNAKDDESGSIKEYGLQLYSLRDDMPKNPKEVLKQVASYGYKQIESYEGPQGMFWGMTNTDFKKYMDDLGMKIVSSHCNINENFEKKAADAAAIGMSYLLAPYLGPQKSLDDFKKFADTFNQRGEICKKNGIRFGYHNHDYSFKLVDGQYPQDVMMTGTDPNLVDYEMDIYWVVAAKQDPEAWLKKYKNRFTLCHVKDYSKTPGADNGKNSVDVGTGSIDFAKVLKTAKDNGMKYYIVEQEAYPNGSPLQAAKVSADYMSKLKV
jgi:sugar phosphate isomerase/epimerase